MSIKRIVRAPAAWLMVILTVVILCGCAPRSGSKLEPDVSRKIRRAQSYLDGGKVEKAEKEIRGAIALTKHKTDVRLVSIELIYSAERRAGITAVQRAAAFAGELLELSDRKALDRKLTQDELKSVLRMNGILNYELQRKEEAFRVLERAVRLWPKDGGLANDLGYLYAESDTNLPEALRLTRLAVRSAPQNGMYVDSLGWVYYKLGRRSDAVRELRRAVALLPGDADVRYHLGMVYVQLHRNVQAGIEFRKALICDELHAGARDELNKLNRYKTPNTRKL